MPPQSPKLVKQLPGRTDEWDACFVLFGARCLCDKHKIGLKICLFP